jgi:hypothetical protein
MNLFAYLEDQGKIITRNNDSIQSLAASVKERKETLLRQSQRRVEYAALDQQFEELSTFPIIEAMSVEKRKL